jgi:uncharacterized protein YodC (DUF2158 family)
MGNAAQPQSFEPGDLVRLKSGGPTMVVVTQVTNDTVRCQWFTDPGELREWDFKVQLLESAQGRSASSKKK